MSTLYPDLQNKFPAEVDDFSKFTDPSISQIALINQYYSYMESGNLVEAAQILESNPSLKTSILNAERLNMMRDGLISIQRYYLNDIQQYLMEIVKNKGDWNSSTKYTKYDVVFYATNGKSQAYMGVEQNIPLGTLPTNTAYFIPLTIEGDKGESGTGLSPRGEWNAVTSYSQYDCVSFNNGLWYAKQASSNQKPSENTDIWEFIAIVSKQVISAQTMPSDQSPGDIWLEEMGGDL